MLRIDAGASFAFNSTALGKVLLAAPWSTRAKYLLDVRPLHRFAEHSEGERRKILDVLRNFRRQSFAVINDEDILGIVLPRYRLTIVQQQSLPDWTLLTPWGRQHSPCTHDINRSWRRDFPGDLDALKPCSVHGGNNDGVGV